MTMKQSTTRAFGIAVLIGGLTWCATLLIAGVPEDGLNSAVEIWGSAVFQIGLVALLATMRATDATGSTRFGRGVLNAEIIAVGLAIAWTIPFLFDANRPDNGILLVLDAFWPISMLGLVVVGVQVVRSGQWPSPARYLPLAASLLIPVDMVAMIVLDESEALVVRALYLGLAYALLGLAIVRDVAPLSNAGTPRLAPGRSAPRAERVR
jgi:hypothetical protein